MIKKLLISLFKKQTIPTMKFSEKSFVFAGKLSRPRKDIEKFIEDSGGKCMKFIKESTSYLVCNGKNNLAKYAKAEKNGVQIISEEQLYLL